jgi:hypothetical protein
MKINHNKIESLLNEIHKTDYYIMLFADDFNSNIEYKLYENHIEIMIEEFGLINHFKTKHSTLYLTKFGRNIIINYGGWLKYLEYETRVQNRVESKAKYDLKISKYLSKTRFLPLIISTLSLFLTIGNILHKPEKAEPKYNTELKVSKKQIQELKINNTKNKIDSLKKR